MELKILQQNKNFFLKEKEDKKEIDVKEHVDALVAGDDSLSEEFKQKAATVFEAAIKSKVKEIAEDIQADYDKKLTEETSKSKDELVEKVDSYLSLRSGRVDERKRNRC